MAIALGTPLCRDLGIEYPIFSVGFGISAGPDLVTAVSDAGGCGVLGGVGLPAEEIRRRIARDGRHPEADDVEQGGLEQSSAGLPAGPRC